MDPTWLIPIVAIVFWIASAIVKAKQQMDAQPPRAGPRNPGQELDKFLQEIDRLRRQQSNRPPVPANEYDEEMPTEERPVVVVRQPRPAPILPKPVVLRVPPAMPAVLSSPPPVLEAANRTPQPRASAASVVVSATPRAIGPGPAATAMTVLRRPRGIVAAFVLQEIFGPPRCKKR